MADYAHDWTDEQIEKLERLLKRLYGKTAREMGETLDELMAEHMPDYADELEAQDDEGRERWQAAQAASFALVSAAVVAPVAAVAMAAEKRGEEIVNAALPEIFAENYNYSNFLIGKVETRRKPASVNLKVRFDLMDKDTARLILNPTYKLVPGSRATSLKEAWYRAKVRACITRGLLTGQSIPKMAKSLQTVTDMGRNAAVRTARTACTHAENSGRLRSYERALAMGIPLKKQWMATLDDRTRQSHRDLDGEVRDVHEKFSNGLQEPGDYGGDPSEYYNCRCTMVSVIDGVESDKAERWNRFEDGETYEDWKKGA